MAGDPHATEAAGEAVKHATGMEAMLGDPTFWATVAVLIFLGILVWKKIPGVIGKSLDDRSQKISDELDHARILREKAQEMLAEAERRQNQAEAEAQEIVEAAKREAAEFASNARADLKERMARREKMAEERIARAEAEATQSVRNAAAEAASAAAAQLLETNLKGAGGKSVFTDSLDEVKKALS